MQQQAKPTTVCVDTRRTLFSLAASRKPEDVKHVGHEDFIRKMLKGRFGIDNKEKAPDFITATAKQLAATLVARDAAAKAKVAEVSEVPTE